MLFKATATKRQDGKAVRWAQSWESMQCIYMYYEHVCNTWPCLRRVLIARIAASALTLFISTTNINNNSLQLFAKDFRRQHC